MTTRLLNVVLKSALLVALAASAALFVDYRAASSFSFCGVATGCAQVRQSAFSHVAGVPLPHIGLAVFAGLLALALAATTSRRLKWLAAFSGVTAAVAAVLIVLQIAVVGAMCKWCMAVDVGALVAGGAAIALARRAPDRERRGVRMLWALSGVAAVAVPLLASSMPAHTELPREIAELQVGNKVTVVTFTDFECPFCRLMHPVIDEVKDQHADRVAVVRLMKPLRIHPGAEPAARVYLCAPEERRDALAHALYDAEPLDRKRALDIAEELGMARSPLERCYDAPATSERLERDKQLFDKANLRGLPSTFVGSVLIEGAEVDAFRAAVEGAIAGDGDALVWMFAALAVVLVVAVAASVLTARSSSAYTAGRSR